MTDVAFEIGAEVDCSDGKAGRLSRVVVDPVARAVTHVVVSERGGAVDRLVPVDSVGGTTPGHVTLTCDQAGLEEMDRAEETEFLDAGAGYGGYGQGQALAWPYFAPGGLGGLGAPGGIGSMGLGVGPRPPLVWDLTPEGEVNVRRGQGVHAVDGEIGKVQGLVIDPADHRVTHVLLQEGHLWARKEVAIPVDAISGFDDGITLRLTKAEVGDLPEIGAAEG